MRFRADKYYIKKVLSGDGQSFAFLVEKHKKMAFNIALKITRNREDAEEVAQDAFIKVYNSLKDFRQKSKFSTWLYKIVYNTAISKIRKKSLETEDIGSEITDKEIIVEANSVISSLKNEEQKKYLKIALDQLNEIDSLLLTLFYYNENSIEEISEITGISSGNVKIKLFRARKKMYIELEKVLSFELKAIV